MGIFGFSSKPAGLKGLLASFQRLKDFVERRKRRLLLVGSAGDHSDRSVLINKLPDTVVVSAKLDRAVREVEARQPDCVVVDLSVAQVQGIRFLRALEHAQIGKHLPVIVYLPKEPSAKNAAALQDEMPWINRRIVGDVHALLNETTLFLHQRRSEEHTSELQSLMRIPY